MTTPHLASILRCPENYRQILAGSRPLAVRPPEAAPAEGSPRTPEAAPQGPRVQRRLRQARRRDVGAEVPRPRLQPTPRPAARLVPGAAMKLADLTQPRPLQLARRPGLPPGREPISVGRLRGTQALGTAAGNEAAARADADTNGHLTTARSSAGARLPIPNYGVPFFCSTDMLEADFINSPADREKRSQDNACLLIERD